MPKPQATFLYTNDTWSFQFSLSSKIMQKNFDELTSAIISPSIFNDTSGFIFYLFIHLFIAEKHM